jgi:hypothetical protein
MKHSPPTYDQLMTQTRRHFLGSTGLGLGAMAMAQMFGTCQAAASTTGCLGAPHHFAKVKRVIFLFMQGGVSQVDSFDPKPILEKHDGQMIAFDDAREFANTRRLGSNR